MNHLLKTFLRSFQHSEEVMELRLYRLICLLASLISLCVILPAGYSQHASPYVNVVVFAFGLSTFHLYRASLRGRYRTGTLFAHLMLALNATWLLNGASWGSIGYYFFAAFIYPVLFFRGKTRWLTLALALSDGVLLVAGQPLLSRLSLPLLAHQASLEDLIVGLVASGLTCTVLFWAVLDHYDREHRRLASVNEELAQNAAVLREAEEKALSTQRRLDALLNPGRGEANEQALALNEELERRVAERTSQLERAIREHEAFSYSVSHDLRLPLRHIGSYATILTEECRHRVSAEGVRCLDQIGKATTYMGKLIDNLLELAQVERSQLNMEPVNLSDLAVLSSLMIRQTDSAREAEFEIREGLTAMGDRTLITLVIENLFSNAWKYTALREKARIEFGKESIGGEEVFFVRDNGTGFDMAYKDKLFGAFQRLHGLEYEGTGIGLATVKRIIDRHQGTIWAEGKPDEGATFFFTLHPPQATSLSRS